ncbi:hypothetical protein [Agromyces larvae]|uniref:Head decoration protein n=1 Tax=Agromyces larvae TaxID=2929802 RepID=A0ABY4C3G9_9MICO|nr:hypothetical protein [Agromyces larvae]UOE45982.1 hypothetical protein MTO99_09635 [Agromyces larvae]
MAHIATQEVFAHTDALVETWGIGAATRQNTLVKQAGSNRFGVTLTDTIGVARPDLDKTLYGDVKITGVTQPGVGNDKATAVGTYATGVATDGTWEFESIVSTGTTPAPTTTAQGAVVYATGAGALTLEAASNTRVGVVNYPATYAKVAGTLPVKVGA